MNASYAITRQVPYPFEEALEKVTEALADEGFGVLSDIDVQAKMVEKLGVEFPPYRILGACAPPLAHKALTAVPDLGVFLPCNVVVHGDGEGNVLVSAMEPTAVLGLIDDKVVAEVANEVSGRLRRVVEGL